MATSEPVENRQLNQVRRGSSLKRQLWNYGVAIAFVLIAMLLMLVLDPYIQVRNNTTFLLFNGALMLASWYGGRNAGILATLLSAFLATYFFVDPIFSLNLTITSGARILIFVLQGCLISVLFEQLHTAQQQSKRSLRLQEVALYEQQAALRELQQTEAALRRSEERQAFLLKLNDTLRPLMDAEEIQYQAACVLGEYLGASRVGYAEDQADGETIGVTQNYTNGVPGIEGLYRYDDYGEELLREFQAGRTVVRSDIANDPTLTDAEKGAFAVLQVGSTANVPLIKAGRSVAVLFVHYQVAHHWSAEELLLIQDVADRTWAAVERARAEAALCQSEERYRTLFESIDEGFCIIEMLFDQNNTPVDYRFVEINPMFERQTGLQQAVGKTARQLVPDLEDFWIETYGRVALTGEPVRFEHCSAPMNRCFDVYACCTGEPEARKVAIVFRDISDRKQAEEDLRLNRDRLAFVLDNTGIGLWLNSLPLNDLNWDNCTREFFFVPPDVEPTVELFWSRLHPDDREPTRLAIEASLRDRTLYQIDHRSVNPDTGEICWIRSAGKAIYAPDGTPIRFDGINYDMTDRKRTEQALRQAEERLRVALQNAPIIVFNQDHELKYTWIHNPVLHGSHEMLGKHDRDYLPPEDAEPLTAIKQRVLETGIGVREEIKITRDRTHYYDLTVEPLRDANNTIVGITCAAIDISELKQSEINLRESEARFRGVVEANMVGILFWDASGCITDGNEMAVQMLGYSQEELRSGQVHWIDITPPEFHEIDNAMQAQLLIEGVCSPFEKVYIRKDGAQVPILIGGAVLPGYSDRGVAYFIDISDRKQAEAEREQLLIREQAAREAAEAASRIKDEFLAVVSHELRSPLNPILGWSKLLQSRQLDAEKTDRALKVIERNAQMQAQLINDLLDVSRILRGKLSLDAQPIDLAATIQAAMETVRLAAEAKAIDLRFVILDSGQEEDNNPKSQVQNPKLQVMGDAGRLQQVIWNLLTNAVKFTSEGGRVEVKLERVDGGEERFTTSPSSSYAQITITDTGKGILPDFLPYVFDQFRQESSATTRRFGGLGLGLAIVRYLVELHGGTIQADSPGEGQGATFTVKLPLMPHQPITQPDPKPSELSLNLQGTRILVVDDDDNTREFLAFLLELHGANVIATATASEALTTLTQFKPEVLLSDIGMPDMDGYMLMQQIRALPAEQGGTILAIALTAYAGEIDYQQSMAAGFQLHLPKPVEPEVLIGAIVSLLGQPAPT
ncbi:MAG: PAS domain S-box protein [Leptolyngbyaceae cyanobacterium SM1_4_3]|nr:PAS domain S-box protein [Leptolyngbyaceae cyanobacterium SM1_4_3]NJN89210.1 PAS domain S-box protein [Leptolyngbyaceae cyanobacterium SL_5_14]NJO66085.1 PAS domain S-box protein [Leptolyngbyaceae cyanobacterium RM1_405_57]